MFVLLSKAPCWHSTMSVLTVITRLLSVWKSLQKVSFFSWIDIWLFWWFPNTVRFVRSHKLALFYCMMTYAVFSTIIYSGASHDYAMPLRPLFTAISASSTLPKIEALMMRILPLPEVCVSLVGCCQKNRGRVERSFWSTPPKLRRIFCKAKSRDFLICR